MAKLTYWCAPSLYDSACYNIRAKTKKEALAILASGEYTASNYGPIEKVEVYYKDAFDLACKALSECQLSEPRGDSYE